MWWVLGLSGWVQMFAGCCLFMAWVLLDGGRHCEGDGNHVLFASLDVVDICWVAWCVPCVQVLSVGVVMHLNGVWAWCGGALLVWLFVRICIMGLLGCIALFSCFIFA